jgi:hypothetical protein
MGIDSANHPILLIHNPGPSLVIEWLRIARGRPCHLILDHALRIFNAVRLANDPHILLRRFVTAYVCEEHEVLFHRHRLAGIERGSWESSDLETLSMIGGEDVVAVRDGDLVVAGGARHVVGLVFASGALGVDHDVERSRSTCHSVR